MLLCYGAICVVRYAMLTSMLMMLPGDAMAPPRHRYAADSIYHLPSTACPTLTARSTLFSARLPPAHRWFRPPVSYLFAAVCRALVYACLSPVTVAATPFVEVRASLLFIGDAIGCRCAMPLRRCAPCAMRRVRHAARRHVRRCAPARVRRRTAATMRAFDCRCHCLRCRCLFSLQIFRTHMIDDAFASATPAITPLLSRQLILSPLRFDACYAADCRRRHRYSRYAVMLPPPIVTDYTSCLRCCRYAC